MADQIYTIEPEAKHKRLVALLNIILVDLRDGFFHGNGMDVYNDKTGREIIDMRDWLEACDSLSLGGPVITREQAGEIFSVLIGNKDYLTGRNRERFWKLCKDNMAKILAGQIERAETAGARNIASVRPESTVITADDQRQSFSFGQEGKIERMVVHYSRGDDAKLAELQQIVYRWSRIGGFRKIVKELAAHLGVTQKELLSHARKGKEEDGEPPEPSNVIPLFDKRRA